MSKWVLVLSMLQESVMVPSRMSLEHAMENRGIFQSFVNMPVEIESVVPMTCCTHVM